jgi:hypothetical protein
VKLYFNAISLFIVCSTYALAGDPRPLFDGCQWTLPCLRAQWDQRQCWCPDDYCAKCLPCVPANRQGCVDEYCRKTLPCVPANPKGCADDYCPKKCPPCLGSLCQPWYTCGPPENPCGPCQGCKSQP